MRAATKLAVAALCAAPAALLAQVLENDSIRVEVAPENGAIVRISDRRSGAEFIADPAKARLFQLMLEPIGERTRRILSWQQQAQVRPAGPGRMEVRFEHLQPDEAQYIFGAGVMQFEEPVLDIAATVDLRLDGEHVEAELRIENRSGEAIIGVIFPQLGGMPLASEAGPARIVVPSLSQRVFNHTIAAFTGERTHRYPAMLATSWLNYEPGSNSLGLEVRGTLEAQDALFALSPGHFEPGSAYRGRYEFPLLGWISYPHLAPGAVWASPPFRIHAHAGDWHQVAAEHREWRRESLAPAPVEAWRERIGFATYHLKRDDNTIDWSYADLEALAQDAAAAGIDRLVIEGWREREGPANPAPRGELADPRLGGAASLRSAIEALAGSGVELIFAFHPTMLNVFADQYPSPDESWTVRTRRGAAQIPVDFLMSTMDYPARLVDSRFRMEIDPATEATGFLLGEAARLQSDYGIRNLLLKGVGQRAFVSYNQAHGLAPQDAYRVGYARLLGGLRERFPDGILLNEGFNDLVNAYGDGGYTWDQSHDMAILPYSIPWRQLSNDVEALDYRAANASFAHGALINLVVDGGGGTVARYEAFARHLRELRALKNAAGDFLAGAEFRDRDGLRNVDVSDDAVVTVFRNEAAGKAGVVMANVGKDKVEVSFGLEAINGAGQGRLFRIGASEGGTVPTTGMVELQLGPYEVAVLGIED